MKSLHILQRLAGQAVDRERQVLQAINNDIAAVEAAIETCLISIDGEAAQPLDFMTSGATLIAYIDAQKKRILDLNRQLAELNQRRDKQVERVRQERTEQKRFERLAERRSLQQAQEEETKQQKAIDELANIKRGQH